MKSKLGILFRYMQSLSREASIVSKLLDIEVLASVRRGAAKIEFVNKPKTKVLSGRNTGKDHGRCCLF